MPSRPQHELEVRPEDRSDHEILIRIFRADMTCPGCEHDSHSGVCSTCGCLDDRTPGLSRRNQVWIDGWQIPPAMKVSVREDTALNEVVPNGIFRQYEPGEITITIEAKLVIHGSRSDTNRELYRIEMVEDPERPPVEMDEDSLTLPTPGEIIERVMTEMSQFPVTDANTRRMLHLALRYAGYAAGE